MTENAPTSGADYPDFERRLPARLQAVGVTSAYALHTGGGVFVCAMLLDPSGRDTDREMWITHDTGDTAILIGLYDAQEHDDAMDTCTVTIGVRPGDDPLQLAAEYVQTFARITGLILP